MKKDPMPQPQKCERCGLENPPKERWTDPICTSVDKFGNKVNHDSHTPQNEKSDQPKPEVMKCVLPCHNKQDDGHEHHCHFVYPSPASTEDWEKEFDEKFIQLGIGLLAEDSGGGHIVLKEEIKSFIRSHDQQLRQRIVEAGEKRIGELAGVIDFGMYQAKWKDYDANQREAESRKIAEKFFSSYQQLIKNL